MSLAMQAHFGNYNPAAYGWGDPRPHLVPLVVNGVSFGQCAREAHGLFVAFLTELESHIEGGFKAGSCWCWSTTDELPDGSHSFHWFGIAVDVNWNKNKMGNNIPDATGEYAIPRQIATQLAEKYGLEWGGNWSGGFHDDMHFEIHLSPAVAATVQAPLTDWFDMATKDDLRAVLTDFLHAKDGKPYGIESLEREALSDVIAQVKQLTVDVAAIKKKLAA